MTLNNFLLQQKAPILQRWFSLIAATYSPEASQFMQKEKDPFRNPVGRSMARDIEAVYDGLVKDAELDALNPALEGIIRIRAVQDFSPSEAVHCIFLLKTAIREHFKDQKKKAAAKLTFENLLETESRIDEIAGRAFDLYMQARQRIFEIRVKEIRNRTFKLLERAEKLHGRPEEG